VDLLVYIQGVDVEDDGRGGHDNGVACPHVEFESVLRKVERSYLACLRVQIGS
jgi:hypothetical protein